jgi:hypothetical protein
MAATHIIRYLRDSVGFVTAGIHGRVVCRRYMEFGPYNLALPASMRGIPTPIIAERFHKHEAPAASLIHRRVDQHWCIGARVADDDQSP